MEPSSTSSGGRALVVALLLVLVVLAIYYFASAGGSRGRFGLKNTTGVRSEVDGLEYRVHRAHGDWERAANTMAALNGRVISLLRRLRENYVRAPDARGGSSGGPRRAAAERLLVLYSPDNLAENSPHDPDGDTSYVLSKGAVVALCLRARDGETPAAFHDMNTLTFVTVHEMSHIATEELDHPPAFWSAFRFLLEEAVAGGIYKPVDYSRHPVRYCGMTIDYSPLYDPGLRPI